MSGTHPESASGGAHPTEGPNTEGERRAVADGIDLGVYRRRWTTLLVLCLALSATMLANTSLGVALPFLSQDLGSSLSDQQWFSNAYALVFAGLLFTTSTLADRYGRKLMLQAGLVLFGAVSLYVCFFVSSSAELIAARGLLGLGGSMIMPVTLSILTSVFPSSERTKAVGVWAAVSGAGTALGPVIAGLLLEVSTWHAVFAINVPVVVVAVIASIKYVPKNAGSDAPVEGGHGGIDIGGAILSTVGITVVVYGLIDAQHVGWTAPRTLIMVVVGLLLVGAFVAWERRVKDPMLDMDLFRNAGFSASAVALTLVFFAMIGVFFSLSQTLILVFGYSPLGSSVAMLPMSVMMVLVAPQVGRIVGRFGPRTTIAAGLVLAACGMAGLSTLTADSGYLHLLLPLVLTSGGMSLAMAPATDQLMANVPRARAGMGSATNDVTREVGASLGVAVLGSVLGSAYSTQLGPAVAGLPPEAQAMAKESLPGGLQVAASLGQQGAALAHEVVVSWMGGMRFANLAGAALILLAALIAWIWMPRTATQAGTPAPEAADDAGTETAGTETDPAAGAAAERDDDRPAENISG
ncbi:MFS transporter [Saccharopolyspora sp. 7B]|uniref:MFS transporter n=1 Tax=Saccharopolyspora sp. 7B TaxID=2877240 RepID=UPI001CD1D9FF|nr:MFS transporter [Saccharopolyspora sp. 7B]MCA1282895.1 MFS transporter [Saccharopolyspora sp. 7B]